MKKKESITAFYLETLVLIVIFITIILVLTQVFGLGRAQSAQARQLTNAVCLAQNAAEAVAASDSAQTLLALLDENGNAEPMADTAGVTARYDSRMNPDAAGSVCVDVTWLPEDSGLVRSVILVRTVNQEDSIYRLDTAVYLREVGA